MGICFACTILNNFGVDSLAGFGTTWRRLGGGAADECVSSIRRQDTTHKINNLWFTAEDLENKNSTIYIYGAYLDDRRYLLGEQYIRVFSVSTVSDAVLSLVSCQLWTNNILHPVVVTATVDTIGRGLRTMGLMYMERLYSCPVPPGIRPSHMSLSFGKCMNATTTVPVVYPEREQKQEFGVCVATAYGKLNPRRLVEWIEFNKILGVSEFNVYNSSVNSAALKVFEYYRNESVVRVFQSSPPMKHWCVWCQKLAHYLQSQ